MFDYLKLFSSTHVTSIGPIAPKSVESAIISPIWKLAGVSLSFFFFFFSKKNVKNVYVQVVVLVAHIFPWFYVQERLKRPLWVEVGLPIQFS